MEDNEGIEPPEHITAVNRSGTPADYRTHATLSARNEGGLRPACRWLSGSVSGFLWHRRRAGETQAQIARLHWRCRRTAQAEHHNLTPWRQRLSESRNYPNREFGRCRP